MHAVQTKNVDYRVRQCAYALLDERLIAKLSAGDMMTVEAKYHALCLTGLYNKLRDTETNDSIETSGNQMNPFSSHIAGKHGFIGLAFAQLVVYIEEVKSDTVILPIFKLARLTDMYSKRLQELGVEINCRVNSTKLKNLIRSYFPDMCAQ